MRSCCHPPPGAAIVLVLALASTACAQAPPPPSPFQAALPPVDVDAYPWLADAATEPPRLAPLSAIYPSVPGYHRIPAATGSFAAWLRGLPVLVERDLVHDYRGRPINSLADSVILMDVGNGDLQQCADTLIRLHAEYLWSAGRAAQAGYHFTSGDLSTWVEWVAGTRFEIQGRQVRRRPGPGRGDDHSSYRGWLQQLFVYAGTMSLARDSTSVAADQPLVGGDFFVDPGSPGHTVMLLDVIEGEHGERLGLVGQGFTPAQELHVIGGNGAVDGVWFELPQNEDDSLTIPSWSPFPRSEARRFNER